MTSADTIPTMIVCRWAKCRQFFDTDYKLARHVLDQHIGTATPVKRKEIALERRVTNETSSGGEQDLCSTANSPNSLTNVSVHRQTSNFSILI